jgi:hypothetical protein
VEYKELKNYKKSKELNEDNFLYNLGCQLKAYIVAFANTNGGTVYFGVNDKEIICGQCIEDENGKSDIRRRVDEWMRSRVWLGESGELETPKEGNQYDLSFFPVDGADENTMIIAVHICQYAGTVFCAEPICSLVNENNEIFNMKFESWLALHKPSTSSKYWKLI